MSNAHEQNSSVSFSSLASFDHQSRTAVLQMLSAVVDYPKIYSNRIHGGGVRAERGGGFEYVVVPHERHAPAPFPKTWRLAVYILPQLEYFGFIERHGADRESWHSFTSDAMSWYRSGEWLDDAEIRRRIGAHYYGLFQEHGESLEPFEPTELSELVGVKGSRVIAQARILAAGGLLEAVMPINSNEIKFVTLSQPEGVRWAMAGFPDLATSASSSINVVIDLRVDVRNVIEQVESANISQELRNEFEARLHRVEAELEKPNGRFESVKEFLETASHAKDLLGPAVGFVHRNWDKIQRLAESARDVADGML